MSRNDYYVLLGVERSASKSQIRRAFQKLARKYHPDINPGDNVAAVRYQRISEAFEILADPEKRQRYDTVGAPPEPLDRAEPARYGFEGFDFSLEGDRDADIFPDLFRRPRRVSEDEVSGPDVHHRLTISFAESMTGLTARFRVVRQVACETCEGWGEIPTATPRPCARCEGKGGATQSRGFMLFTKPCNACGGSGFVQRERCPDCRGAGRSPEPQTLTVEIPPGVADGEKLTIPGGGSHGRGAARPGDLSVHIEVKPDPVFTRRGDNLYCTVPVSFTEAALGTKIEVPTPEKNVTLRIPAGVQSSQKLRLSGRGAPSRRASGGRGDLFVEIQVVTPEIRDDRSRELLRELERLNPLPSKPVRESRAREVSS